MSRDLLRSLDRAIERLERRRRRPARKFPASAVTLVLGLFLGQQLLARLVPIVWTAAFEERRWGNLGPLHGELWRASLLARDRESMILAGLGLVGVASAVLGYVSPTFRRLTWLASVLVLLLDAALLFVVFRTGLDVAGGLP